jgi:uncharacterized membrane protein
MLAMLAFASVVCCGMLAVRAGYAWNRRFSGLFGNLLLAWIPFVLALVISQMPIRWHRGWFWSAGVAWVLFFPNAYYLVTDLIHMTKFGGDGVYKWFDMMMTASFAFTGIFLGTMSLYVMHLLVRARFGWRKAWAFATTILALGSFGIFLGRALRLNSWDVVSQPGKLMGKIAELGQWEKFKEALAFSTAFFFFSLAIYALVVSMARLHEHGSGGKTDGLS